MKKNRVPGLLLLGMVVLLCVCGRKQTDVKQEVSSVVRQFAIGSDEDAIYIVSAADTVSYEQETVSGNSVDGLTDEVKAVLDQVNQARADIGLDELNWNEELAAAAAVRAQEIQQVFSHTRPDGSDWWTVNSELIYGENLARGYQSADSVMQAWMKSAEHKDNILYSGFQTIGIAVYKYDGRWYWAQEFGY